jgi:hypothetical protein
MTQDFFSCNSVFDHVNMGFANHLLFYSSRQSALGRGPPARTDTLMPASARHEASGTSIIDTIEDCYRVCE